MSGDLDKFSPLGFALVFLCFLFLLKSRDLEEAFMPDDLGKSSPPGEVCEQQASRESLPEFAQIEGASIFAQQEEPVVVYTPALFYRYGLRNGAEPYFEFLKSDEYKNARSDTVFPLRIVTPRPFIAEGDVYLSPCERSTLYVLPANVAELYFNFLSSMVMASSKDNHVVRMAVVALFLRDPFALAVAGPVSEENLPLRQIYAIVVETRDGRYSFVPEAGKTMWQAVKGPRGLEEFLAPADTFK